MSPRARKQGRTTDQPPHELKPGPEEHRKAAELTRAESEEAREQAERVRALAEEGRELSEEVRRSAEALRLEQAGIGQTAEQGRQILDAAIRAETWFKQRFDDLLDGVTQMSSELERLRKEATELRRTLSDMQQATREEQIITAERQATERQMDRERHRHRR